MSGSAAASPLIVAVDQGTGSTKAIVVDADGTVVRTATVPVGQAHPRPGWVEQDAAELAASVDEAIRQATAGLADRVVGVGLSTQRESAVLWDRQTGAPLGPVLGWQDRRTVEAAEAIRADGDADRIRSISGLPLDPMFSALKFGWLLDDVDPDRAAADAGRLALGTVDSWLLSRLTGEHRIELGNASRTQLLDVARGAWSDELLERFRVPAAALPALVDSDEPSAPIDPRLGLPAGTRVLAVLGDSHAALFGHGVRRPGAVKATYGTGSSIMGLLPPGADAGDGLVTTIAWAVDGRIERAFEGNILATGATLVWLAELLGTTPAELMTAAERTEAVPGLDLVPAFAGLGAPWWDDRATAVIAGFDLGTDRAALARAAADSIALQVEDVLAAADAVAGRVDRVLADGGPSANPWLMQLQADLSGREVATSTESALSALGAARLAGRVAGLWTDERTDRLFAPSRVVAPRLDPAAAAARRATWRGAVARARQVPTPVADRDHEQQHHDQHPASSTSPGDTSRRDASQ